MAYTRTWNGAYEAIPDGGDERITVDNRIRELKQDIRERMESVFYWTIQDPITVKPEFSGVMTGKVLMLHASDFRVYPSTTGTAFAADYSTVVSAPVSPFTVSMQAGLMLPVSAVITNMRCWFFNESGTGSSTVTQDIHWHSFGVSGVNSLGFANSTTLSGGGTGYTAATNTQELTGSKIYFIRVTMTMSTVTGGPLNGYITPNFYGAEITYNVPTAAALR